MIQIQGTLSDQKALGHSANISEMPVVFNWTSMRLPEEKCAVTEIDNPGRTNVPFVDHITARVVQRHPVVRCVRRL